MNQQDAIDAFDAILQAMDYMPDVVLEGEKYEPDNDRPYVTGRMAAYTANPIGVGADCVIEYTGSYQVSVNTPTSFGRAYGGGIASQICAEFPRGLPVVTATGKILSVIQSSELPANPSGAWITIPVTIQWFGSDP